LFIISSAIYILVFRIQSIRRVFKSKKIIRNIANVENSVQKLEGGKADDQTIQMIRDEICLLKVETAVTKKNNKKTAGVF
jgi:hypothetical protein